MKNILMIAYYFPPLGGAGVQRTLKFAKYLNRMGYNINILTVENDDIETKDETLENDLEQGIKVYRSKQNEIKLVSKLLKFANRGNENKSLNKNIKTTNFLTANVKKAIRKKLLQFYRSIFIPDDKITWKRNSIKMAKEIIRRENIDIIYSTSAPYTSHLIAYDLKKQFNIPWICDFRDPWVMHHFVHYSYVSKKINSYLERKVILNCDKIISVSQPIIDNFMERYPNVRSDKFKVITNGYDEDDFIGYNKEIKSDKFIITYTGTIYGKESLSNFFIAVRNLIVNNKIIKDDIVIRFVGRLGREANEDIEKFNMKFENIVEVIEYLPHKQSIKKMEESSALLLLLSGGSECKGVYTGKIFEYIRSSKPIIALVPDGVAKDLINDTNTGIICNPDKINEIESSIYKIYLNWKSKKRNSAIDWDKVYKYNRKNLSIELADIIEKLAK